jgi:diacylglycerol O-acyltransferase
VPMSVTEDGGEPTSLGSQVAPHLQNLPIGEPNALMRLHQVAYATQAHKDSGRAVGARSLSDIAGFAPTTLHALGVRVSTEVVRKQHDLVVTNVPGPQVPLFAAGSRLVASFPVLPLSSGHLLTIGVTSYDGEVFFGLNADRDAIRDLDTLAQCLTDALEELLDTTVRASVVRQPTRKASPAARRAAAKKAVARQEAARKNAAQKRAAVRTLVSRATELGAAATSTPPVRKLAQKAAAQKAAAEQPSSTRSRSTSTARAAAAKSPSRSLATKPPAKKAAAKKAAATDAPSPEPPATEPVAKPPARKRAAKKAPETPDTRTANG